MTLQVGPQDPRVFPVRGRSGSTSAGLSYLFNLSILFIHLLWDHGLWLQDPTTPTVCIYAPDWQMIFLTSIAGQPDLRRRPVLGLTRLEAEQGQTSTFLGILGETP